MTARVKKKGLGILVLTMLNVENWENVSVCVCVYISTKKTILLNNEEIFISQHVTAYIRPLLHLKNIYIHTHKRMCVYTHVCIDT